MFCNQQRLCRGLPLFSFIDIENQVKDFTGRIISFEKSGKNYLQRVRGTQVWRELRIFKFFVPRFHLISKKFP